MISSLVVEAIEHPYQGGATVHNHTHNTSTTAYFSSMAGTSSGSGAGDVTAWQPPVYGISISHFGEAFMNFVFAFMAHAGVPGLVQLMEDKKAAPKTFIGAMSTACLLYLMLGTIAALYFGIGPTGVKSLVTLNWFDFNGAQDPSAVGNGFTIFLSYLVRLYPCISVTSAFVLYADTLASSLRVVLCTNPDGKCLKIISRWIVIWLSVIGAAFMIKIDVIVGVCGIFGVNLVMVFPALLQVYSKQQCQNTFGRHATPYSWHFSKDIYAWLMLGFAVITAALGLYSLIHSILHPSV